MNAEPTEGSRLPASGMAPGSADTSPAPGDEALSLPADAIAVIPVRAMVLFPGVVLPVAVGRPRSMAAAQAAARGEATLGLVLQRDPEVESPGSEELHSVGTSASVLRYLTAADGSHHIVCQGERRFRIREFLDGYPYLVARVDFITEGKGDSPEIEARVHQLKQTALEALQLLDQKPPELVHAIQNLESAATLADLVASFIDIKAGEKQEVLETFDLQARLDRVLRALQHRVAVLKLSQEIGQQTKATVDERQREYLLREQLKTIQRELGEGEGTEEQIRELSEAIERARMPEEVERQARKELRRLERIPEASAEHSMVRTYLEWLVELPWSEATPDNIDIAAARRILDEDHYGLEKVKRRILEYLAVRKLNPQGKSPILCFLGPPGVGKTSLGQSIARAIGRKFVRAALGGVHDEAEIRGHRRTYVGALPGNVIQSIHRAGTNNPVFMLDELDKLGASFHGDPSSALLEVLDPEQNSTFKDNYLGVPFDLSRVMFIGTANVMDSVPGPLRDRMEVIELPGYTEEEKREIARRYLVGRQLEANGVTAGQVEVTDEALRRLINDYTREAGCRNLERQIGAVFRHAAMRIAEGRDEQVRVDAGDLHAILGPARFEAEVALRTSVPGVATGLAWTPTGGDLLFVEASRVPGSGKLILTGQLGDVMKESAQAALSLIKGRSGALGFEPTAFEHHDVHIHVPAGAIPKDGPSAGVAMYTALLSLLTERTVRHDLAMTGEISLRGLVLPVGGIKEKVVAAARAGVRTVLLPARNRKDLEEIPQSAQARLELVWLERVDELADLALSREGEVENRCREAAAGA